MIVPAIVLLVLSAVCLPLGAAVSRKSPELRSISTLGEAGRLPVKVRGAVTLIAPGFLVIEDQSGAVEVRPAAGSDVAYVGDEVEVTGTSVAAPHPALTGVVQRLWSGSAPLAGVITPDVAADGQNELALVNLSGQLVSAQAGPGGGLVLILEGEHQFFTAYLQQAAQASERWPDEDTLRRALRRGATLQVTGVLDAAAPAHGSQGSFTLALRSPNDIVLLAAPPWWTPVHITGVFLALMALAVAAVVLHIRNLRLRFRAVTEERLRIARDIHDTMAQGFAGIALQLQAAEQTLPGAAEETQRHLELALGMVRYSRRESHRSIQMLRSLATGNSLGTMLDRAARQASEGCPVRIEVVVEGQEPKLPYDTAIQLYRIGQEAMANAVQHACAQSIGLILSFRKDEIAISVTDDGHGFDPSKVESNGEHFGLAGMRERVEGLRGQFDLHSSPAGSSIFVVIPLPA